MNKYVRSNIEGDSVIPPYLLTGNRRVVCLIVMFFITAISILGALYTAYYSIPLLLFGLFLCYFLENTMFILGHMGLHAAFIELPEKKMETLAHHAFVHHYRNIRVFHETWLETRLSYFFCPKDIVRSMATYGYIVSQLIVAIILMFINPLLGISALSCMWLVRILQALVHEWYHNKSRKKFYSKPVYYLLYFLEKIHIISTKHHVDHHRHNLNSLEKVEIWLDLYIPMSALFERIGDYLWLKVILKYKENEERITEAVQVVYAVYSLIHYLIIVLGFLMLGTVFLDY